MTTPNLPPEQSAPALAGWPALLQAIAEYMRARAAHPARCVVLLPFFQLVPLVSGLWAQRFPDGFMPRFETTRSWAARVGAFAHGASDLTFEHGRDLLTAGELLEAAGLGAQRDGLAAALVEQATLLARAAATVPAAQRAQWMERAHSVLPSTREGPLAVEAALGRTAVAWAGNSSYATDVLFEPRVVQALDLLFVVPGLQDDPLARRLADHHSEKAITLALQTEACDPPLHLHPCHEGADEAERAAGCVLQHLRQGRAPVALVAVDRAITRRVAALLAVRGVPVADETGWKLSTTHAAARLGALLRAAGWQASSDDVLDWLKLASAFDAAAVSSLERELRQRGTRAWAQALELPQSPLPPRSTEVQQLVEQVEAVRAQLRGGHGIAAWLKHVREALMADGQWSLLAGDPAGVAVLDTLQLAQPQAWDALPAASRRVNLQGFTHWLQATLEAADYRPPTEPGAAVVLLPLSQLFGRSFMAAVVAGADEQRLPAAPDPAGPWTEAQREVLYLPTRAALQREQASAFAALQQVPHVDILWRGSDEVGESLSPSPLVQMLQLDGQTAPGLDPRETQEHASHPVSRPAPSGAGLPVQPLSASGYDLLRNCPYQFFALRQLGLSEEGELDQDVDKRDFGLWVHDLLHRFHRQLQRQPQADRSALMDQAAQEALQAQHVPAEEFLPFQASWPVLRDAYLGWLAEHEAGGTAFESAEEDAQADLDGIALRGRLDRVDRLPDGAPFIIDYKTESQQRTRDRRRAGSEDTQLPFYALLANAEGTRAAYLNLSERDGCLQVESPELAALAELLRAGIAHDLERVAAGAPMPALGQGKVCDWCPARGLCRKDFWLEGTA